MTSNAKTYFHDPHWLLSHNEPSLQCANTGAATQTYTTSKDSLIASRVLIKLLLPVTAPATIINTGQFRHSPKGVRHHSLWLQPGRLSSLTASLPNLDRPHTLQLKAQLSIIIHYATTEVHRRSLWCNNSSEFKVLAE